MTLKELRAERGLAMDALALLAGVDTSTVSRIEAGRQRARPETVVQLAKALGISARRMQQICDATTPPQTMRGTPR